ncbi:MAG: isocitrate/isopropylmalate dehydrogenase family protein [Armatimonadota bacterium]
MAAHRVTLIAGDGIGPEVAAAAERVVEGTGVQVAWDRVEAGAEVMQKYQTPMPDHVLNAVRTTGVALKGPLTTPIGGGYTSPTVRLRQALELYACLRPVRSLPGLETRYQDVDLVVVRENTEGLYSGLEHMVQPGIAESLKVISERASLRIARFAFELAQRQGRRRVTVAHKANIMKLSDGLFLECARRVARDHPEIELEELIIDAACMRLVTNPEHFQVLLMDNLYGDIVSELCAGLVGGLGVVPGANYGDECAVFEAVHGSAPDIAGRNVANPIALIRSAALMLEHLGEPRAYEAIEAAVNGVLARGDCLTPDLGGQATTTEVAEAIVREMEQQRETPPWAKRPPSGGE